VVSSTEAIPRAAAPALQVELSTASASVSNPDPFMGEECQKDDLNTAVGEDARSRDMYAAARILPEMVAATWEVHRLWEILPMASRVPSYTKNPTTQKDRVIFNNRDSGLNAKY
jgi:hypothetical protein